MKGKLLLSFFLFSTIISKAQTGIYKTYEDYAAGKIEKMQDEGYYAFMVSAKGAGAIFFTDSAKQTHKYLPNEIWGFLFKGHLFRSTGNNEIAMLMDTGKVYYYENGYVHMQMLQSGWNSVSVKRGASIYLSVDGINGKLYGMPLSPKTNFQYKQFLKDYAALSDLVTTLDKGRTKYSDVGIKQCVANFNMLYKAKS